MRRASLLLLAALATFAFPVDAKKAKGETSRVVADCASTGITYPSTGAGALGQNYAIGPDGRMCVTASVSASISGFAPAATGTPITATTSGVTGTLPAGAVVAVFNTGTTNTAYCKLGATSTTSDIPIQPGSWFSYTVGAATQLTCITSTSTTTVSMIGGSGLPTGAGGGGSGGGGGSVTQGTSPWIVAGGGTAGSAATGVVTVQGIASMTPFLANPGTAANWGVGATGAAIVANANFIGFSQGGNLVGATGTSGNLNVQCANCSGSGVSTVDAATFTASTSLFAGTGGFFQTTATNNALTNGQQGMLQMTANRAAFTNLRNASGTEVGTSAAEVFVGGRGTAGSAAGGVLTVQGVASMTPLFIASGTGPSASLNSATASAGVTSALAGVFDDTSPTTITENNFGTVRMSANRNLYGTIRDAAGNERGAAVNASNQLAIAGPVTVVSGGIASGAVASGAIASGAVASGAFASGSIGAGAIASGAAVSGAFASGALVDVGAAGSTVCATDTGSCNVNALLQKIASNVTANTTAVQTPATLQAATTGGASPTGNIAANNTTAVVVKASAGTLYGVQLSTIGSVPLYLKIYNATSATCGSGTPVKRLIIPKAGTAADGGGSNVTFGPIGVAFSTGITYCVTAGIADSDTTAPASNVALVNIDWK